MIAAARYLLSEHLRTRGFVAPTVVLLAGVVVLYAQPPNPVLSTAGTVAAFLFAAQCWLALGLLANLGSAVAGTALAALFSQPIVRSRAIAVLGLSACALLTLPLDLPPVVPTARALDTTHAGNVPGRLAGDLASVALFTIAVGVVCSLLWRRRE